MAARLRWPAAFAAGLLLVALVLVPAGAAPADRVDAGRLTCVTSGSGYCTGQPHGLGAAPAAVVVTVVAPISGPNIASAVVADSFTATTFRVRVFRPTGAALAGLPVTYSYVAVSAAGAPPTTTPPATTTPPPTTQPPPPGCASPSTDRGCFPAADNTGVPAGTPLTVVDGDLETTADGQVINGRDVRGWILVRHNNVTIRNSRMQILDVRGAAGTVVEDSEIQPSPTGYQVSNFPPVFPDDVGGYTLRRVEVRGWQDGPRTAGGPVLIEDSLLHDLAFAAGEHPDGYQQYGPGSDSDVVLRHNAISGCAGNSTDKGSSAMFWSDHPGPGSTLQVMDNWFSCGQYSIRINDSGPGSGVVVDVHRNTVDDGAWALGPAECTLSAAYDGTSGIRWTGNVLSSGAALPYSACGDL
jgi:hypothetical protein